MLLMAQENVSHHIVVNFANMQINIDTLMQVWFIMGVILLFSSVISKQLTTQGISLGQFIVESFYDLWSGQIKSQLDEQKVKSLLPFIGGIFVFFLFAYWAPLLPWKVIAEIIPGWPEIHGHKWQFHPPILDMNMPVAIALLSLLAYQWEGIKAGGIGYILAFVGVQYHHGKVNINLQSIITMLIEWMDMFTRPFTLSLRIYANVMAGEALGIAFLSIASLFLPVVIYCFEFSIAILQSFIFAILSLVYIKIAIAHSKH